MAFTVSDFSDLARLLEEHPEWRLELRRLLLSDELLSLPQALRELVEVQRRAEERLAGVEDRLSRAEDRLAGVEDRLAGVEDRLSRAEDRLAGVEDRLSRLETTVQDLAKQVQALVEQVRALVESQHRMGDTMGSMKGRLLELTYHEKAGAYFGPLLRRLRVVEPHTLEDVLEANLTPGEFRDLLRLDLLLSGHPRHESPAIEVWLAVEISVVVDQGDIDRAERRAKLLKRAGYRALPVAAGEGATLGAEESARIQKVALLRDGNVSFWEEALQAWVA